jgi:hypothetical protein
MLPVQLFLDPHKNPTMQDVFACIIIIIIIIIIILAVLGLNSNPVLARQVFYYLSHNPNFFCFSYFSDRVWRFVQESFEL